MLHYCVLIKSHFAAHIKSLWAAVDYCCRRVIEVRWRSEAAEFFLIFRIFFKEAWFDQRFKLFYPILFVTNSTYGQLRSIYNDCKLDFMCSCMETLQSALSNMKKEEEKKWTVQLNTQIKMLKCVCTCILVSIQALLSFYVMNISLMKKREPWKQSADMLIVVCVHAGLFMRLIW